MGYLLDCGGRNLLDLKSLSCPIQDCPLQIVVIQLLVQDNKVSSTFTQVFAVGGQRLTDQVPAID
jgi:hypothetical protein